MKRALWAYGTGVKRTETGYEEETHGFLEIDGLQKQALKVKIWVRGEGDGFYKEPAKYMLEEKVVNLNDEGKASFLITTDKNYKEKIEKAIPKTVGNPNPEYRLIFTVEMQSSSVEGLVFPQNILLKDEANHDISSVTDDKGKTLFTILEPNEELTLTSEQKITKILFSTEDGKDIQRTITTVGKTHNLQVHTVNMQDETLKVDILKEIAQEQMQEADGIISALESVLSSAEGGEKVGKDGLLEFPVTVNPKWLENIPTFIYLIGQVSQQFKDPADETKKIWKVVKAQYAINGQIPADIVTTEDKDHVGIKAVKKNGEAFTQAEMAELRKRFLQYNSSCLKVVKAITPEAIENDVVPVVVEMAEVRKQKTCYCDRDFTEEEMRDLIKTIKGNENIFNHKNCSIQDKSISKFTSAINSAFRKYDINKCIQKITFLAQAFHESDEFNTAEEYPSSHASSQSVYKGRGLIQMTGTKNTGETYYNRPGPYEIYGKYCGNKDKFVNNPNLISSDLFFAVDSSGWLWSINKKVPNWKISKHQSTAEQEAVKWKITYFKDGLGKSLNELAIVMENVDEDKYFYLQSKMLNGYTLSHKLEKDPNGWAERKKYFGLLKTWFRYDKNVCKDGNAVLPNLTGRAPWMELVWKEEAKKLKETGRNKEIQKFFDGTPYETQMKSGKKNETDIAWCAAFINWIMKHYGYKGITTDHGYDAVRALKWAEWAEGRNIGKPVYGAIAVKTRSGGGHVGFVAGKKGSKVVILGGNQSQKLYCVSYEISDYFAYVIPKNYEITEADYNLPEYKGNPGAKGSEL